MHLDTTKNILHNLGAHQLEIAIEKGDPYQLKVTMSLQCAEDVKKANMILGCFSLGLGVVCFVFFLFW